MVKEWHMIEKVSKWNPRVERQKVICENIQVKSTLLDRLNEVQKKDCIVQDWVEKVQKGEASDFNLGPEEIWTF